MATEFKYISNQFIVATQTNYKKALELSSFHVAQLQKKAVEDPVWIPRSEAYTLLDKNLVNEYSLWQSAGGKQEGDTLNLNQLLKASKTDVGEIEVDVLQVYKINTPDFKKIFPNGRKPLTSGKKDTRIAAFLTLSNNIGNDNALAVVKARVDAIYDNLINARDAQNQAKGGKTTGSSKVQQAVEAAMTMQYRTTGWVMDNFYDTRDAVCKSIFNLELLRSKEQRRFTGTLDESENEAVLIHTFIATDKITAKSNGNAAYKLYLSDTPNGINSTSILVEANKTIEITLSQFGDIDLTKHRYLTAINQSSTDKTQYVIEI